ncbi:MAG: hypothetical protein LBR98_02925, partial [Syntrophomonadaceae bacterium]|nr:hypothetical protein [Syntrophomonadaceae bacterium]
MSAGISAWKFLTVAHLFLNLLTVGDSPLSGNTEAIIFSYFYFHGFIPPSAPGTGQRHLLLLYEIKLREAQKSRGAQGIEAEILLAQPKDW